MSINWSRFAEIVNSHQRFICCQIDPTAPFTDKYIYHGGMRIYVEESSFTDAFVTHRIDDGMCD